MPISLTFLLKSSLASLVPFEDVFCTGPEQQQPGKGEEAGGCRAAAGHDSEPAGSTRQRQRSRHGAAPLLQLPSEKKSRLGLPRFWDLLLLFTLLPFQHLPTAW